MSSAFSYELRLDDTCAMQEGKSRQGGLTRAFRSSGKSKGGARDVAVAGDHSAQRPAAGVPETSPLGRSPSRNFMPANHLLNFRYDRFGVSFTTKMAAFQTFHCPRAPTFVPVN